MRRKREAITGVLVGEVKVWTSQTGVECASFYIKQDNELYNCIAFDEKVSEVKTLLKKDERIHVRGYYRDEEDRKARSITVETVIPISKTKTKRELLIEEHGSIEKYEEWQRGQDRKMEEQGYVKAKHLSVEDDGVFLRWRKTEDCVHVPGDGWWNQIDFAMWVLGPKVVAQELSSCSSDVMGMALNKGEWSKAYKEKRAELVKRAFLVMQSREVLKKNPVMLDEEEDFPF